MGPSAFQDIEFMDKDENWINGLSKEKFLSDTDL